MQAGELKLRIYSDKHFLPEGVNHAPMLIPFWGPLKESGESARQEIFSDYASNGQGYFELVGDPQRADLAVVPAIWNHYERAGKQDQARAFASKMRSTGKTVLVFVDSDRYQKLPFDNAVVFRTSLLRSRRKEHEFAAPAWSVDLLKSYCLGKLQPRTKTDTPVVGFCGLPSPEVRRRALDRLAACRGLQTNFLLRQAFFGGSITWTSVGGVWTPVWNEQLGKVMRDQFVRNTLTSDYVLCIRGNGNFSHRLYETLLCGRIPVFVDTDCLLPYHDTIAWRQYCVWCDESELDSIGEIISNFHRQLSTEEFVERQLECRRLWEHRLSPHGFFAHFYEHFL